MFSTQPARSPRPPPLPRVLHFPVRYSSYNVWSKESQDPQAHSICFLGHSNFSCPISLALPYTPSFPAMATVGSSRGRFQKDDAFLNQERREAGRNARFPLLKSLGRKKEKPSCTSLCFLTASSCLSPSLPFISLFFMFSSFKGVEEA